MTEAQLRTLRMLAKIDRTVALYGEPPDPALTSLRNAGTVDSWRQQADSH